MDKKELMVAMFEAAVQTAQPSIALPPHMPKPPIGRTIVIGAGKASAAMAQTFENHWQGELSGLVITRYGYGADCKHIEVVEASHPVPDEAGEMATRRMLDMVSDLTENDVVVCLISGGGSALLSLPADGLTLEDKQQTSKGLLKSGATISEMNCVRKHLSAIKGGHLAAACQPAKVVSLLISDVPGDDLSAIASGPTVADPTTFEDARAIIEKYSVDVPSSVMKHLLTAEKESIKPGDARLNGTENTLIATPQLSLEASADIARREGYSVHILGDSLEGEARDVALIHAGIAKQVIRHQQPFRSPCVLLSGGETTVTVRGKGRGGRNAEFALALSVALDAEPRVSAIACDTDGIDGTEDNAGALIFPEILAMAEGMDLDAKRFLANNDGYSFFKKLNLLVMTGPTNTNVNDFRALIID